MVPGKMSPIIYFVYVNTTSSHKLRQIYKIFTAYLARIKSLFAAFFHSLCWVARQTQSIFQLASLMASFAIYIWRQDEKNELD